MLGSRLPSNTLDAASSFSLAFLHLIFPELACAAAPLPDLDEYADKMQGTGVFLSDTLLLCMHFPVAFVLQTST